MKRFEALRDSAYGVTYAQSYLEQGRYGEAVASTGAEPDLVNRAAAGVVRRRDRRDVRSGGARARPSRGLAGRKHYAVRRGRRRRSRSACDSDRAGEPALSDQRSRRVCRRRGEAGLAPAAVAAAGALAADYDNDGRPDILLLRADGLRLLHQRADRSFEDVTARAGIQPTRARYHRRLRGHRSRRRPRHLVAGRASCATTATARSPTSRARGAWRSARSRGRSRADRLRQPARHRSADPRPCRPAPALSEHARRDFRDVAANGRPPRYRAIHALASADVNKDGYPDFFFGRADAPGVLALSDGRGRFTTTPAPAGAAAVIAAQFVDYDNDGLLDVFTAAKRGLRLFRNLGGRWTDMTDASRLASVGAKLDADVRRRVGDLDRDGDLDAAAILANGALRAWRNDGGSRNRRCRAADGPRQQPAGRRLEGRSAGRKPAAAARDVRGDALGGPADVLFGLGPRSAADVVRVHLAVGTLQAETTGDARTADDRRARSQAVVVSVSLHVERHAVRVRDRFHGRRRDGLLGGPRALEHAGSR